MTNKLRSIYALIGELSTKLSGVELGWYRIFCCLMHQTPGIIRDAIINTQWTGDGQRQIVMATAKAVYPDEKSEARKFIKTLKIQTGPYGITANCVAPGFVRTGRVAPLLDTMSQDLLETVALRRYGTPKTARASLNFWRQIWEPT